MNFANVMKKEAQTKLTENGAVAYDRLNGSLVTLFAQIGALRHRSEKEIEDKFASAFNEDRLLATKMLFKGNTDKEPTSLTPLSNSSAT